LSSFLDDRLWKCNFCQNILGLHMNYHLSISYVYIYRKFYVHLCFMCNTLLQRTGIQLVRLWFVGWDALCLFILVEIHDTYMCFTFAISGYSSYIHVFVFVICLKNLITWWIEPYHDIGVWYHAHRWVTYSHLQFSKKIYTFSA
jgi:hypothetical protein